VELLKYGLVAKNPDDRQLSVAEHVAYGSRDGKSRYISTSSSLDAVQHFRYMKTQERCKYGNGRTDIEDSQNKMCFCRYERKEVMYCVISAI
jgi:hypothetical protein